jgi:hypothetical protein
LLILFDCCNNGTSIGRVREKANRQNGHTSGQTKEFSECQLIYAIFTDDILTGTVPYSVYILNFNLN